MYVCVYVSKYAYTCMYVYMGVCLQCAQSSDRNIYLTAVPTGPNRHISASTVNVLCVMGPN